VGEREITETYLISASKNTSETDVFSSRDKIFVDQCYQSLHCDFLLHSDLET